MLVNLEGLVATLSRFFSLAAERTRRAVSLLLEFCDFFCEGRGECEVFFVSL